MSYDVMISFAGEDRKYARSLSEELKRLGIKTFFDEDEQSSLWGTDNRDFFVDLILRRTRFCVMVLSEHYAAKKWPTLERQAAFAKSMESAHTYVLPIRLDDAVVPGLLPTTGYVDGRKTSVEDVARIVFDKVHDDASNRKLVEVHPGSQPTESSVASRIYDDIKENWPTKRKSYSDGFLQYDADFLINAYSGEIAIDGAVPYTELSYSSSVDVSFSNHAPKIVVLPGEFSFDGGNKELEDLRRSALAVRRKANVGASNEMVVSVQGYDAASRTLFVQRARYHDQAQSNLAMDFVPGGSVGRTMRTVLADRFQGRFPPFGSRLLADTLGAAVLIFYRDGDETFPYLVPRSSAMPVFPGGWHASASGAVAWPNTPDQDFDFGRIVSDVHKEICEEIGLFSTREERFRAFNEDPNYAPFRGLIDVDGPADFRDIRLVSICREMLRGGKPQLFFFASTDLSLEELIKRRIVATKVAKKKGQRVEVDARLAHLLPELEGTRNRYSAWRRLLWETGYTFELIAMLYYSSKSGI